MQTGSKATAKLASIRAQHEDGDELLKSGESKHSQFQQESL